MVLANHFKHQLFLNAPVAQLVERKAYTLRMHQISARLSVRARPGVPNGQVTERYTYRSQKPSCVGSNPTLATINMRMNFATLCQRTLMLESAWATLPNPPANYALQKKAVKSMKKDPTLAAAFKKAMNVEKGAWDKNKSGPSWEIIRNRYAYERYNLPLTVKMVAFDVGGFNSNRALGYIDENNDYQILDVMTHEDYNKIVKAS